MGRKRALDCEDFSLPIVFPDGMKNVNNSTACNHFAGMNGVWWNYRHRPRSEDFGFTVDRKVHLTLDNGGDLFMGVRVLWQKATSLDVPGRKCHVLRMYKAALETGNKLFFLEFMEIEKRHKHAPF
jgi:hypothetical protein